MKIRANGIDIHYVMEGSGPCVILSHALGADHRMWEPQVTLLAERFTVLRPDTRGHGQTAAPVGPYSFDMLAADAAALLDALEIEQAHWLGLSMGGMIGQAFALNYPQRLLSLVLADTSSRYPAEAVQMWDERIRAVRAQGMDSLVESTLERWFTTPFRAAHPDLMQRIGDTLRNTPVEGYVGCGPAIARLNFTEQLHQLRCPTLVIVGEDDTGTPPGMAREIHAAIEGSELVILPNAAHLSNIEQADAFNAALTAFYDRVTT